MKFLNKIQYVHSLDELAEIVPMEHVHVPDCVVQYVSVATRWRTGTVVPSAWCRDGCQRAKLRISVEFSQVYSFPVPPVLTFSISSHYPSSFFYFLYIFGKIVQIRFN